MRIDKEIITLPASPREVLHYPVGGVYGFIGESDQLLYVGISDNVGRRISAHLNGGGSQDIFRYNRDLLKVNFFEEENPLYRDLYESYLIYTLNPRYNIGKTDKEKLGGV